LYCSGPPPPIALALNVTVVPGGCGAARLAPTITDVTRAEEAGGAVAVPEMTKSMAVSVSASSVSLVALRTHTATRPAG
jgi:hypothetical protein